MKYVERRDVLPTDSGPMMTALSGRGREDRAAWRESFDEAGEMDKGVRVDEDGRALECE